MFFSVAVDLPEGGMFEFSTESILEFMRAVAAFGDGEVFEVEDEVEDDEEGFEIPEEVAQHFVEGEEDEYDDESDCWCWYDEQHEAWYWLNIETGEWLLVEDADGYEVEAEDEEDAV